MASPTYHFISNWKVKGTSEEVFDLFNKPMELVYWWPAVYLEIEKEEKPGHDTYHMNTKGWLPYAIKWKLEEDRKERPSVLAIKALGDLEGTGVWTITQNGEWVDITYDWRIKANKAIFRYLSFILRPLFSFNHKWAMRKGEKSLKLELHRLRCGMSREEAPKPPLATWPHRRFYRRLMGGK